MKTAIPAAVENRPWLFLLLTIGICFAPAFNVSVAEWQDAVDASATTAFQPELLIDAWADGFRTFCLAIFAYLTRATASTAAPPPPRD